MKMWKRFKLMRTLKQELARSYKLLDLLDTGLDVSGSDASPESYQSVLSHVETLEKNERSYMNGASLSINDESLFQLFKSNRLASRRLKEILQELARNIKKHIDNSPNSDTLSA